MTLKYASTAGSYLNNPEAVRVLVEEAGANIQTLMDFNVLFDRDAEGNILGLPPTIEALEGVDFDGAGVGTCLIWYLRFEDGLVGAEMGANANDLQGNFDLSNSITVEQLVFQISLPLTTTSAHGRFLCVKYFTILLVSVRLNLSNASSRISTFGFFNIALAKTNFLETV